MTILTEIEAHCEAAAQPAMLGHMPFHPQSTVTMAGAKQRTCSDCPAPITRFSKGRCKRCAATLNSAVAFANGSNKRVIPDDFAELAAKMSNTALRKHYRTNWANIDAWREQSGIPSLPPGPRPDLLARIPEGFEAAARSGLNDVMLAERFGLSRTCVGRYRRALGIAPADRVYAARRTGKAGAVRAHWRQPGPRPLPDARDNSRAGLAAQYLQRFGPVFRCDPTGRADPSGTHWNRGGRYVLTDAEIMERAERNGWVPDQWKEITRAA